MPDIILLRAYLRGSSHRSGHRSGRRGDAVVSAEIGAGNLGAEEFADAGERTLGLDGHGELVTAEPMSFGVPPTAASAARAKRRPRRYPGARFPTTVNCRQAPSRICPRISSRTDLASGVFSATARLIHGGRPEERTTDGSFDVSCPQSGPYGEPSFPCAARPPLRRRRVDRPLRPAFAAADPGGVGLALREALSCWFGTP